MKTEFVDEEGGWFHRSGFRWHHDGITAVADIGRSLVSFRWLCHLKMIFNDSTGGLGRELKITKFRTNEMQFG